MGQLPLAPPPTQDPIIPQSLSESACHTLREQIEIHKEYTALKYDILNIRRQYYSADLRHHISNNQHNDELPRLITGIQQYNRRRKELKERIKKCQEEMKRTDEEIMKYVPSNP